MASDEQAEAGHVLFIDLDEVSLLRVGGGRDVKRKTVKAVILPPAAEVVERRIGLRVLLLVSSVVVAILTSVSMWVFHAQLGVGSIVAARGALILTVGALIMLFVGLYRILIIGEKVPAGNGMNFGTGKLSYAEYLKISAERTRLSVAILILLHMGWVLPVTGVLVAILGPNGALRITGLATGAGLGALTVFIRSTALPMHRQMQERLKEVLKDCSRLEPKKAR